jgi:hypothetical protein
MKFWFLFISLDTLLSIANRIEQRFRNLFNLSLVCFKEEFMFSEPSKKKLKLPSKKPLKRQSNSEEKAKKKEKSR